MGLGDWGSLFETAPQKIDTLFTSTQGEEKVPSLDAASPFQAAVISIAISLMRRSNVGEEFGAGGE